MQILQCLLVDPTFFSNVHNILLSINHIGKCQVIYISEYRQFLIILIFFGSVAIFLICDQLLQVSLSHVVCQWYSLQLSYCF